jgi:hypothetical protein
MRTLAAGVRVVSTRPLAAAPLLIEGIVAGGLVALHALPAGVAVAPASAVFPLDIFFDLKQGLALSTAWPVFGLVILIAVVIRGIVLGSTLWLADGAAGSPALPLWRAAIVAGGAAVLLFPSAGLFFAGVAIRYAPFIWLAAIAGFVPSVILARRAVMLDAGAGAPSGKGVPEIPGLLSYGYLVTALGAAMAYASRTGRWAVALLLVAAAPIHVLFLLGWREHARARSPSGGGTLAVFATAMALIALIGVTAYDRIVRTAPPVATAPRQGSLLLLGGVDSTSSTGALADFDSRQVGFRSARTHTLSYRSGGRRYAAIDTHANLKSVARIVSRQIPKFKRPRDLLGHSQAALIVDRILAGNLAAPSASAELAPPPPAPSLRIPARGENGPGRVGVDFSRAFSWLLDKVGLQPYDIEAPASPGNLRKVVVTQPRIPRLAVWALGDSVWLDRDWRRRGEVNVIALSDHVGVTNDAHALTAVKRFFGHHRVAGDEQSWRSYLVVILKYAFAPWRP